MGDNWFGSWFAFNCNYVNLPVFNVMLGSVMLCGILHMFALASGDVMFRKEICAGCKSLHFNEDRDIALLRDDVNFTIRGADVSGDDLKSALL